MNLRKWMRLFGLTILLGGLVSAVTGTSMALLDPTFSDIATDGWIFNIVMMALSGLALGAFAHMGFFAYLTLNYIARSIFKRPYLWMTFQAFVTGFVLVEIMVNLYDTNFPSATFWVLPIVMTAISALVAWRKVKETSAGAWIPSFFFLITVTVLEANPAFRLGNLSSLVFMLIPLYICNTYQIMLLHRILGVPVPRVQLAEAG